MSSHSKHSLAFPLPAKSGDLYKIGQLTPSSLALVAAEIINQHNGLVVFVTQDMQQSIRLRTEITTFTTKHVTHLPDWEILPYDTFSPPAEIVSQRLACLYELPQHKQGALILPINTLMQKICPYNYIMGHVLIMHKGMTLSREELRRQLEKSGYRAVEQVMEHGEFATRGALFDLFPMGSKEPYRIDFFDEEIDSIRTFDSETQRTLCEIDHINLLPAHEFPTDKTAIETFRTQWREQFDVRRDEESLYQQVTKHILPAGIEFWQPLFFSEPLNPLFNYFPTNTLIVYAAHLDELMQNFWLDVQMRYENRQHDTMRPLLEPNTLWLRTEQLFAELNRFPRIAFSFETLSPKNNHNNLNYQKLPEFPIQINHKEPLNLLKNFIQDYKGCIIFSVETEGRKEIFSDLLKRNHIVPQSITTLNDINAIGQYIMIASIEQGFIDIDNQYAFIAENDLVGEHIPRVKHEQRQTINTENLIRSLAELNPGQPVVHLQHGVGRYVGLTTLETGGIKAEYMVLLYAGESKLYVPISSLNMISRYLGGAEDNAPLHKLGGETWSKARQKAAEKIRDVAVELLDISSQREIKKGVTFEFDRELYAQFCQLFPYELTPDQQNAINAVISDMKTPAAMDRLVCGDVGFGKTEVAIRAAFIATMNNKQVAILVPTTLLAQQHYENFLDRFAGWPIKIEMISRFRSAKEQLHIINDVAEGKIDILIGTHKLLQNELQWRDLGLLIVDEEHRFGVRQKERIKAMRANIDILTLTATPIPRTLNMAMHGMRDLSIIATPPARRLAIKTFVREYDNLLIRESMLREILRGGQVYYLYNDVEHIEQAKKRLQELVPEARIAIGHGQMNERALERVMNDFHHQRYNVLICTTIIETGIDVPSANTIIIERADRFGLAQLHQLRGRVGRSYHQAYAYLLTPPPKLMSSDAHKRLEAIASLEDLGAGFALATHDLEIRGAGELLGEDQSGQITTIGFTLYMELLENAVKSLKSGKQPSLEDLLHSDQTEIELRIPALIPDNYIADINTRLSFYKRIAGAKDKNELNELQIELIDRFGLLPDFVKFLFSTTELRQRASQLGIKRIEVHDKGGFIVFNPHHHISIDYLIHLIQQQPSKFRLEGENRLKFTIPLKENLQRITFVDELLTQFEQNKEKSIPQKVMS